MWIVLTLIFILVSLTLVLSFPSVQTKVAQWGVNWVNDNYQTHIELQKLRYVFPDRFLLKEVYIPDEEGDTLIYASQIDLRFEGFNTVTNTAHSNSVKVNDLKFYYLVKEGDSIPNLKKFTDKFKSGDTTSQNPFSLNISQIAIQDGRFHFEDLNCDSCFRFDLHQLNIAVEGFELEDEYVNGQVKSLSANDKYGFGIKSFESYVEYQADHLSFENLDFKTSQSHFDGDVVLKYDSIADFQDFVNKVIMEGQINEAELASEEIQHFGPEFPDFGRFSISGSVDGIVNDMKIADLDLKLATQTHLSGALTLKNTTDPENIFLDASQIDLQTLPQDIHSIYSLFSDSTLPKQIDPLGKIHLSGNYKGYFSNFTTKAQLETDLGKVNADLLFQHQDSTLPIKYKGELSLSQFNMGILLGDSSLGTITTDLQLDGKGFDPTSMNTKLSGQVSLLQYNNYSYTGININGKIRDSRFQGKLKVNDPNLKFNFDGTASFGKDTSNYNFKADVVMADLHALNFAKDSIAVVTAEMDINLVALNYDRWAGDARLYNTTYENDNNFYFFQDIVAHSEGLDSNRYMEVRSSIADADLRGNYSLEGIVQAFRSQISKFVKTAKKVDTPEDQDFNFDITIKNTQVITEIFMPALQIEPNTKLIGNYSSDSSTFNLDMQSPGFDYRKTNVRKVDLSFHGGATHSQLGFDVAALKLASGFEIDSISLGNFYYNDTLFYDLRWILRDSIDSHTNLLGYALQQDTNSFEFGIFESKFNIGFQKFTIQKNNKILLDTGGIHIDNLVISNQQRSIYVNGNISNNPNEVLRLNLRGFGMELANYFIGSPTARFKGELYGDVILTEVLDHPKFAADLRIDSLEMNNTLLGDFKLSSNWAVENDTINIASSLKVGDLTTLQAEGYYQPDSTGSIDFKLDFDRFRLAAFDPLVSGIAENLRGFLTGKVEVGGNTGAPIISGELEMPNTGFTISLLQTDYNFVGTPVIKFSKDRISFPDLVLYDKQFGKGTVTGNITHNNFRDFKLDLNIDADNLLVLNTTAQTEDPYFGTAFVSGDIGIKGPVDNLKISADVTTEKNTHFYLPIDGSTEVSKTNFVTFVNPNKPDSTGTDRGGRRLNLDKGVSLDFKFNINENADVAIIIDSEVDNQLEAKGSGIIRLTMDPYSDIEMYGTYTVSEGYYNFVLSSSVLNSNLNASLLKRKFDVLQGGTVTWNGDPLGALINLTARYTTKADPSALYTGYSGGRTLTVLDLYLSGELMDPEINFDISTPRAGSNIQSILNNQLADRNKQYTQVFSLLALNRFAPDQGLDINGNTSQSLAFSALATQATSYINQVTGDYQFSLDYQAPDKSQAEVNNLQKEVEVGVSKRFFNERVTVNTSLGVALPDRNANTTTTGQNQIAGDFEVEYNITPDGRFRAKAFNRSVQDRYVQNLGQQNYQQGVGVFYRVDFDSFGELLHKIFSAKDKNATKEEEEEDHPKTEPLDPNPGDVAHPQ